MIVISFNSFCGRVLPKIPDGSLVSRIKVVLQAAFSKSLIKYGKVILMNLASDLAVKINAWIIFPNSFKEDLP